jgi:hypothetical protein
VTDDEWGEPRSWVEPHDGPQQWDPRYAPPPPPTGSWQPGGGPNHGWGAPEPPPNRSKRTRLWLVAAGCVLLLAAVGLVNVVRNHGSSPSSSPAVAASPTATATAPNLAPSDGAGGSGSPVPTVSCPLIRDEQSHLAYRCIDNYLTQGRSDTLLGLRISMNHETEPGWVISEGSGNPASIVATPSESTILFHEAPSATSGATPAASTAEVRTEVRRRTELAVLQAYGDSPSAVVLNAHTRTFSGVTGFEMLTQITINPTFRAEQGLKAKTERLWVVGVPTQAGVSIFMLSIPDARKDLWPKAEATVGTIQII